jgi:hypothetical protein
MRIVHDLALTGSLVAICLAAPAVASIVCDPDEAPNGTVLTNFWPGVALSRGGDPRTIVSMTPVAGTAIPTGNRVFGHRASGAASEEFSRLGPLVATFDSPIDSVRVAFGKWGGANPQSGTFIGSMSVFDAAGTLLATNTLTLLPTEPTRTLQISMPSQIARAHIWSGNDNPLAGLVVVDQLIITIPSPSAAIVLAAASALIVRQRRRIVL